MLLISFSSWSQLSVGGIPPSFEEHSNRTLPSEQIDRQIIQAPDRLMLESEDQARSEKGELYRVAKNITTNLNVENSGTWETLSNGDKLWRLRIESPGAMALGIYYSEKLWLPQGSQLYIYNNNKRQVIGAFTADLNNQLNPIYVNEMIQGDALTLEYFAPANVTKIPTININQVAYFYRNVEDHLVSYMDDKDRQDYIRAQQCQVNVSCSEGNGWQDEIDAVVHYTFSQSGNTFVCSGSMIANTSADCTPYLLTADHCGNKTSTTEFNNNVWYFNYQNPNCDPGTTYQYPKPSSTMTGAIFRASSMNGLHQASSNQVYGSDFTLVELNTQPPSSYNVFYAGWDRRNISASSGKGIHHPAGHDKKISTYASSLQSATYNGGLSGAHWEVVWAPTANGHGVTEGGSSGSPIFDQNHRIVGDLSGGSSYCSSPYSSDLYGKFSVSWDQLSNSANGQLKAWLDPSGTGINYIDGMRPPCSGGTSPGGCVATVSTFPYSEGFESGTGLWSQTSGDDLDWTNQSGGTPSSNTGPAGAFEGSFYMYVEASSPNYPSKSAFLVSPCFDLSAMNNPTLDFSYNMYGANMGTLRLDYSTDQGATWNTAAWSISGDQGTGWQAVSLDLSSIQGGAVMLRFAGITGSGYTSDIAIDDLSIQGTTVTQPSTCASTVTNFPYAEGFESGTGLWIQGTQDDIDWLNQSGGTPSSGTGPSAAFEGNKYMYIEASSPNYPSKTADLISPCLDLTGLSAPQMNFSYHMYGSAMGSLNILISTDNGASWNSLGTITGDKGDTWNNAYVDLSNYTGQTAMIKFTGTTGSNYTSDICIDAFSIADEVTSEPEPTSCNTIISSFPYSEGFEGGLGLWTQATADDIDWTNQSGVTPSSNTGPSGALEGTRYMYVEASSPNYPSKSAYLESPCFDLSAQNSATLSFAYHMYGASMGILGVEVSLDQGASWSSANWSVSGDQGSNWQIGTINLSGYTGNVIKIRFIGITGSGYTSDICLDDVSLSSGSVSLTYCQPSPTNGTTDGDYIDGVVLGSISNTSSGGTGTASYKDYTNLSTDLTKGASAVLYITEGGYSPDRYAAWIDYNQDGDFSDSGEKIGEVVGTAPGSVKQIAFNVPSIALTGATRMRIRCLYNGNADNLDPCVDGDYGESEDYTVNLKPGTKVAKRSTEIDPLTLNVYPNPSTGKYILKIGHDSDEEVQITVLDLQGNSIKSFVNTGSQIMIDITNEATGMYLLRVQKGELQTTKRLIKN